MIEKQKESPNQTSCLNSVHFQFPGPLFVWSELALRSPVANHQVERDLPVYQIAESVDIVEFAFR